MRCEVISPNSSVKRPMICEVILPDGSVEDASLSHLIVLKKEVHEMRGLT